MLHLMRIFNIIILLTLGVNNIQAQSYTSPPTLIFTLTDDKPTMVILSSNGEGILTEGDTLSIRIYNEQEYKWLYSKVNEINLNTTHIHLPLPLNVLSNLKQGGMHYISINDKIYIYPNIIRELHISQSKQIFKDY